MPTFFETAADFRAWLNRHAAAETELSVGFHKRATGRASLTWPESVDEALCVGWIDGIRKRIDDDTYQIRFTPRKPASIWSAVNIERVRVLQEEGRMTAAGLAAYARRREARSVIYSYEQDGSAVLAPAEEVLFRRSRAAWKFFTEQPPGYRKLAIWRVVSTKRTETRQRRLAQLIDASKEGRRL